MVRDDKPPILSNESEKTNRFRARQAASSRFPQLSEYHRPSAAGTPKTGQNPALQQQTHQQSWGNFPNLMDEQQHAAAQHQNQQQQAQQHIQYQQNNQQKQVCIQRKFRMIRGIPGSTPGDPGMYGDPSIVQSITNSIAQQQQQQQMEQYSNLVHGHNQGLHQDYLSVPPQMSNTQNYPAQSPNSYGSIPMATVIQHRMSGANHSNLTTHNPLPSPHQRLGPSPSSSCSVGNNFYVQNTNVPHPVSHTPVPTPTPTPSATPTLQQPNSGNG